LQVELEHRHAWCSQSHIGNHQCLEPLPSESELIVSEAHISQTKNPFSIGRGGVAFGCAAKFYRDTRESTPLPVSNPA